jgi:hypothetical protein
MEEGDKRTVAEEADELIAMQLTELMRRDPRVLTPTEGLLMREASLRFSARSYVILKEINASLRRLCKMGRGEIADGGE